jgi:hypothetical protein
MIIELLTGKVEEYHNQNNNPKRFPYIMQWISNHNFAKRIRKFNVIIKSMHDHKNYTTQKGSTIQLPSHATLS